MNYFEVLDLQIIIDLGIILFLGFRFWMTNWILVYEDLELEGIEIMMFGDKHIYFYFFLRPHAPVNSRIQKAFFLFLTRSSCKLQFVIHVKCEKKVSN